MRQGISRMFFNKGLLKLKSGKTASGLAAVLVICVILAGCREGELTGAGAGTGFAAESSAGVEAGTGALPELGKPAIVLDEDREAGAAGYDTAGSIAAAGEAASDIYAGAQAGESADGALHGGEDSAAAGQAAPEQAGAEQAADESTAEQAGAEQTADESTAEQVGAEQAADENTAEQATEEQAADESTTEQAGTEQNAAAGESGVEQDTAEQDAAEQAEPERGAGTFTKSEITDDIKVRINGISYPAGCTVAYEDLRYLRLSYVDYSGRDQVGELICNKAIADDLLDIFSKLYEARYQIAKIRLVDEYGGDDTLSITDDNTSCFNYRVVEGTTKLSKHALGLAIDLNPFYNPYVTYPNGGIRISPPGSEPYAKRDWDFPHRIDKNDLAYKLFKKHGFTWGGDWKSLKDYQHFQKG